MSQFGGQLSRRSILASSVIATSVLVGRGRVSLAAETLQLLCWGGYDDPNLTSKFRETTGFGVGSQRIGANDEFFTFLRAGGIGKFDLVTPGDGVVSGLAELGLIQPIDITRLQNFGNLMPRFRSPGWSVFNGQVYAIPVGWRTSPMVYRAGSTPEPPTNWLELLTQEYAGKIVMTDDVLSHFTIWNRALGAEDPVKVTKKQLNQTVDAVLQLKKNQAVAFVSSINDLAQQLARGPAVLSSVGMENALVQPGRGNVDLRLARPAPGDFSVCEALCIVAESARLDAAYAFIDEMLSIESQIWIANAFYRGTAATEAVPGLDESVRNLYNYDDLDSVFDVSPIVGFPPLSSDDDEIATYVDWVVAWDRVRYTGMGALNTPTPIPDSTPAAS